MDLSRLPWDILRKIIWQCDILSALRLTRCSKRMRTLINERYWNAKVRKVPSNIRAKSSSIKVGCIIFEIRRLRRCVIQKYEKRIPPHDSWWYRSRQEKLVRMVYKYEWIFINFPDDRLFDEIRHLHKNLRLLRGEVPQVLKYIVHTTRHRCRDDIYQTYRYLPLGSIVEITGEHQSSRFEGGDGFSSLSIRDGRGKLGCGFLGMSEVIVWRKLIRLRWQQCWTLTELMRYYDFTFLPHISLVKTIDVYKAELRFIYSGQKR